MVEYCSQTTGKIRNNDLLKAVWQTPKSFPTIGMYLEKLHTNIQKRMAQN